jgi:DNA-directed RNA polymerase specialized sigma24 family protein
MADMRDSGASASTSGSVTRLIDKVRSGDEAAVGPLLDRYLAQLRRYVLNRLSGVDRGAIDESALALDAYISFISWVVAAEDPKLDDREDLWKVLSTIALRKSLKLIEKQDRRGQIVRDSTLRGEDGQGRGLDGIAADGPSPVDEVISQDLARRCMELLDDQQRRIVELRLQQATVVEIAEELGISVASVGRKLRKIREAWKTLLEEGE